MTHDSDYQTVKYSYGLEKEKNRRKNWQSFYVFQKISNKDILLSYDVETGSNIKPCNKINKPLHRFSMTLLTSRICGKTKRFHAKKEISK